MAEEQVSVISSSQQETKPIWQSKTLWTNALMAGLAFWPAAKDAFVSHPEIVLLGWGVLNMILRVVTKSKIQIGD